VGGGGGFECGGAFLWLLVGGWVGGSLHKNLIRKKGKLSRPGKREEKKRGHLFITDSEAGDERKGGTKAGTAHRAQGGQTLARREGRGKGENNERRLLKGTIKKNSRSEGGTANNRSRR